MASFTNEQNEAKKQQLNQPAEVAKDHANQQVEPDEMELSEDELDKAAGGVLGQVIHLSDPWSFPDIPDLPDLPDTLDLTLPT
jgi:hypothetical protein